MYYWGFPQKMNLQPREAGRDVELAPRGGFLWFPTSGMTATRHDISSIKGGSAEGVSFLIQLVYVGSGLLKSLFRCIRRIA